MSTQCIGIYLWFVHGGPGEPRRLLISLKIETARMREAYSYICVHKWQKQSISNEVNNAENEYLNITAAP